MRAPRSVQVGLDHPLCTYALLLPSHLHFAAAANLLFLLPASSVSDSWAMPFTQPTPSVLVSGELGGESLHSPAPALLWECSGFWVGGAVGTQQLSGSWSHVWVPSAISRVHWEGVKQSAELGGPGLPGE